MTGENRGLWVTVIVEAIMIVAIGLYNMYEIRQVSDQVQEKIASLSEYSAEQGKKIDTILTALEMKYGEKAASVKPTTAVETGQDERVEKALEFLGKLNPTSKKTPPDATPEVDSAATSSN